MSARYLSEKDFGLKVALRKILWAQGYTTRVNVQLGYDLDPRGRSRVGRAGLTDLDVLGLRIDHGFRVQTIVGECKSGSDKVAENLFWLSGVSRFFGADGAMLLRSGKLPDHTPILARSLGVSLVNHDDLTILTNIYAPPSGTFSGHQWNAFFSAEVVGGGLEILGRLPDALRSVNQYREMQYWMQAPYQRLTRTIVALRPFVREKTRGPIAQAVFADFVWLYVLALWEACERLASNGLSRIDQGLKVYLSGDEIGLQNMQRLSTFMENIAQRSGGEPVSLPLFPPYYDRLLDLITRCLRRPAALGKMAQRAEWLLLGQLIEPIGPPPWRYTDDDIFCDKLLGDVALFLGQNSGVDATLFEAYLGLLHPPSPQPAPVEQDLLPFERDQVSPEDGHAQSDSTDRDAERVIIDALADSPEEAGKPSANASSEALAVSKKDKESKP